MIIFHTSTKNNKALCAVPVTHSQKVISPGLPFSFQHEIIGCMGSKHGYVVWDLDVDAPVGATVVLPAAEVTSFIRFTALQRRRALACASILRRELESAWNHQHGQSYQCVRRRLSAGRRHHQDSAHLLQPVKAPEQHERHLAGLVHPYSRAEANILLDEPEAVFELQVDLRHTTRAATQ